MVLTGKSATLTDRREGDDEGRVEGGKKKSKKSSGKKAKGGKKDKYADMFNESSEAGTSKLTVPSSLATNRDALREDVIAEVHYYRKSRKNSPLTRHLPLRFIVSTHSGIHGDLGFYSAAFGQYQYYLVYFRNKRIASQHSAVS